jgi:hypothetical protein
VATDLKVLELTNADRQFYPTLGPYLANRDVVRVVGGPIWDDDAKTWLVVVKNRKVLGFVAVASRGNRTVVESLYASPGLNRVASELVGAAVAKFGSRELHATVTREHLPAYLDAGFAEVGATKKFVKLIRKEADHG